MKTIAICQARMASTRLPGKVLKHLDSVTTLERVYDAASAAEGIDEVWIATSNNPLDNEIVELCDMQGMRVFRGDEIDVVSRYMGLALKTGADVLVRLTCDCPFLDPSVIAQVVKLRQMTNADYASNIDPATYPDGLDCEVFTVGALKWVNKNTSRPSDRDTVTAAIRNNKYRFKTENLTATLPGMAKERWVLDSPEDLTFCEELAKRINKWPASHIEILNILDREPGLRNINAKYSRNERYYDGMASEDIGERSYATSNALFIRANQYIPLAAQTFSKSHLQYPEKAPLFVTHGDGGYVYDVDGNDFVDMVGGLLPVILGYRDPDVDAAIRHQLDRGISFSLSTGLEADLAERLRRHIPCAELSRFAKNGTDATTMAVRLARAYTGRRQVVICGGYHGWNDWSLASTNRHLGIPVHPESIRIGAGQAVPANMYETAAIIVEPEDNPEYLAYLRNECDKYNAVLIFDEIITGFRYGLGGAQQYHNIIPDLACFGKAMANGMPISAVVGKKDIMMLCEPPDNIFFSGTFFGETLSIAAAIATIDKLKALDVPSKLTNTGLYIRTTVHDMIERRKLGAYINLDGHPCLNRITFKDEQIKTLFIQEMIRKGVLIVASHNLSLAHGKPEIGRLITAWDHTLDVIAKAVKLGNVADQIGGEAIKSFAAIR